MTGTPTSPREAVAHLAHDVGKYIGRIARNVDGEVPPALAPLLLKDVYETHDGRPALARLASLTPALGPYAEHPRLLAARDALERAARLEPSARALDPAALRALVDLAREVESQLRALARAVHDEGAP
jgi:hypothetical protein